MKKVLGLSLMVALFASCSDDDKGSSVDMSKLTRKWYFVSTEANGENEPYEHYPCAKDYLEFSSGGAFHSFTVDDCDGNTVSDSYEVNGTYTTSGHNISVSTSGDTPFAATITKLTASQMVVTFTEDWDGDGDEETVTETFTSTP